MANKKKHLSFEERFCLKRMLVAGETFTEVARVLTRGLSTVSEEVNENGGRKNYDPRLAHQRAYWKQYRKKRHCNKVALDYHLLHFVDKQLRRGWSPETIASRLKHQSGLGYASGKSIRKFIGKRPSLERFLFWERNDRKGGPKRRDQALQDPGRKFLDLRPVINGGGHWEGDFLVSKHNSWVLLVLIERQSQLKRLALLPNRNNDLVNQTILSLLKNFQVKTMTFDNDIAFRRWRELERESGSTVYFCHPYHSWEKGSVENANRWIREFVPKRSDLAKYSATEIKQIENWFNHTPRQCLQGATPYEKMIGSEGRKLVANIEINFPILRIWG
jgi:transposase, IS30 family